MTRAVIRLGAAVALATVAFGAGRIGAAASEPAAPATSDRVVLTETPTPLADFELTDQDGKALRLGDLRGQPVLIFFGFAHCPDVCPSTLRLLKSAHASKDRAMRRARIVMISVDGERDSPDAMKAYLAPLSKDFIGLTGDPKKVQEIARGFQAIFFKGPPVNAAGDYNVQHTSQIYLVDAQGRLRATFFEPPVNTLVEVTSRIAHEKG
jgi:protein SCO1/2